MNHGTAAPSLGIGAARAAAYDRACTVLARFKKIHRSQLAALDPGVAALVLSVVGLEILRRQLRAERVPLPDGDQRPLLKSVP